METKLKLELKPVQLNRTTVGVPFLGYRLLPYQVRLLQKSKQRYIQKARMIHDNWQQGHWTEEQCQTKYLPLAAFLDYADALAFKHKVNQEIEEKVSHRRALIA